MPKLQPHELNKEYLVENYEIDGLRAIAIDYGVELHPKLKNTGKAADQILEVALTDIRKEQIDNDMRDTMPPAKVVAPENDQSAIMTALQPYIDRGLKVKIEDDVFEMKLGRQTDSGNVRQPIKNITACAERIMRFQKRDAVQAQKAMEELEAAQEKVRALAGHV